MGTDKRDRQKAGRLARAEAELTAARKARTRRTAVRVVIGVAAVLAVLFAVSLLSGDDGDSDAETASDDTSDTTATTLPATTTTAPAYTNPELADEVLAREAPDPEPPPEDTAADALETETLIEGEGEGAVAGDQVTVHYIGKVPDGTVFDQSWERGQPFPVTLGQGMVIDGWDQGLVGARIGERRRLVLGSELAYGAQGNGSIPPDTPLAFEVDVIDIQPAAAAATTTTAPAG